MLTNLSILIICVFLAGIMIYNYRFTFNKYDDSKISNFDCVYKVVRKDGTIRFVMIMKDRKTYKYRIVNITYIHSHVCKCEFDSLEDALNDINNNKEVDYYEQV